MSEVGVKILAIVTTKTEGIKGGGIPVFIKQSEEEFQAISKRWKKFWMHPPIVWMKLRCSLLHVLKKPPIFQLLAF